MPVLALTHRPTTFAGVLGQPHITPVLSAMVDQDEIAPAYLFAGPHGTGKSTAARVFAASLNCASRTDGDACGQCESCAAISQGRGSLVLEVDAASAGGVSDVEKIREICLHTPPSAWRCVILDEAQSMSREAFNALLKMLEEPPERTVFVLVTTEPDKILKTVKSRALPFHFRPVPPADVAEHLWRAAQGHSVAVEPQLCAQIAMHTRGHVRDALMALDQCLSAGVTTRSGYLEAFTVPDVSTDVLTALAEGSLPHAYSVADGFLSRCADPALFVSHLTGSVTSVLAAAAGDRQPGDAVQRLAMVWSKGQLFELVRLLWEFADRHKVSADPRTQVRLVISRMAVALDVELHNGTAGSLDSENVLRDSGLLSP